MRYPLYQAAVLMVITVNVSAANDQLFATKSLEAFTEPCKTIEVAAPEPGRIAVLHVQRGSHVKKGDLLVELDTSVLNAAKSVAAQKVSTVAKLDAAKVEHEKLKRRYKALLELADEGVGTKEELAEAEANSRVAELGVRAVQEELQQFALELAEIETRIEQRRIRAEIDGIVTEVYREASEFVSASEPQVVTLVDLSQLRATFYLPTEQAVTLTVGTQFKLTMATTQQVMPGVVEYVGPTTQADSGRVRVDFVIDNAHGNYRSGLRCVLHPHQASTKSQHAAGTPGAKQ